MLYVRKLSEDATIPTKSPDGSFLELYSAEEVHLDPREKKLIRTNLQLKVPRGTCGRITTLPNSNGVSCLQVGDKSMQVAHVQTQAQTQHNLT